MYCYIKMIEVCTLSIMSFQVSKGHSLYNYLFIMLYALLHCLCTILVMYMYTLTETFNIVSMLPM